jgi:hypothetical protein
VDSNQEKNMATIVNFLVPFVLMVYLGIVLKKVSVKDYNHLVTNRFLLLGPSPTTCPPCPRLWPIALWHRPPYTL